MSTESGAKAGSNLGQNSPGNISKGANSQHTVLLLSLDEKGSIENVSVKVSSGDRQLDESCMMKVQKSSPFPSLPKSLVGADFLISCEL